MKRREFIGACGGLGLLMASAPIRLAAASRSPATSGAVDRSAIVRRHNPVHSGFDPHTAASLGNGEFAFTADLTGLQTFARECSASFPLCTTSHWAWHSFPIPPGLSREDFRYKDYDTFGRKVGYPTDASGQETLFNWLRQNPHRLHLGEIALEMRKQDGSPAKPSDLKNARQNLDLWSGILDSRFEFEGQPVRVRTCVHGALDAVGVCVDSPLLQQSRLAVVLRFPYPSPEVPMADWSKPQAHSTVADRLGKTAVHLNRRLDATEYHVVLQWQGKADFREVDAHSFRLSSAQKSLDFTCLFSPARPGAERLPDFSQASASSARRWEHFWTSGGAIDLSGSADPRAQELERRMVLSIYQTAIHCAGTLPSAETGLLFNSWYGKFHLEMHWWHSVHFAAWNRFPLFERSLGLYRRILPLARETARRQGYRGARWPKMIGPDGYDSPSPVGPLLIWQQPHPLYYAELCYRQRPSAATLQVWREVVFDTAEFMASFAIHEPGAGRFVLGPPLKTVSENTDALTALNPGFELSYWRFGLTIAQNWRERLGLGPEGRWQEVLDHLSPPPVQDGRYLLQEGLTDTYTRWNWEHPALVGAFGMLPGDGVDPATMRRTVTKVMEVWSWDRAWGWDFGMMAMAAARVGEPGLALDALLINSPKNHYWPNGHNYQRPKLEAYLPGNGSLLCALAMMAAGWTGGPGTHAPGFPTNGKWQVRHEGLRTWL